MNARAPADADDLRAMGSVLSHVLAGSPLVEFAFGHGSFFAGLPYHDVDVAVQVPRDQAVDLRALGDLAARCEQALGRPVDVHALNDATPGFRKAATEGILLWARDPESALLYAELLQRMAWDWRSLQDQVIRDLGP